MTKLIGLTCALALLVVPAKLRNGPFSKYKRVEAYEVRPGILMMPRYAADGQVCMAVLQKDHYVDGVKELDSTLPREAIMQIFDELALPAERGPLTLNKEFDRLEFYGGNTVTAFHDYKNVSIDISRPASSPGDIVAVIQ
jgi:hypothetical protein